MLSTTDYLLLAVCGVSRGPHTAWARAPGGHVALQVTCHVNWMLSQCWLQVLQRPARSRDDHDHHQHCRGQAAGDLRKPISEAVWKLHQKEPEHSPLEALSQPFRWLIANVENGLMFVLILTFEFFSSTPNYRAVSSGAETDERKLQEDHQELQELPGKSMTMTMT